MNFKSCSLLSLTTCLILTPGLLVAQIETPITQGGTSTFGIYQPNGIDTVNLQNGSVSLHIPLLSYPQRSSKLHLSFSIRYSTVPWEFDVNATYLDNNNIEHYEGSWTMGGTNTNILLGANVVRDQAIAETITELSFPCGGPTYFPQNPCDSSLGPDGPTSIPVNLLSILTSDGGVHVMGEFEPGYCTGSTVISTMDGTNFVPVFQPNLQCVSGFGLVTKILGPDGVTYSPASYTPSNGSPVVFNQTDPEGNSISVNTNGWIDSLGRLIPGSTYGPGTGMTQQEPAAPPGGEPFPGITAANTNGCTNGATAARVWNVPAANGTTATFLLCYSNISGSDPFPSPYYISDEEFDSSGGSGMQALTQVVLPDQTSYTFTYGADLNISSISLPTGGSISYTYQNLAWGACDLAHPLSRVIATRTVTNTDGSHHTWTYSYTPSFCDAANVTVTDPAGNQVVHTFSANGTVDTIQYYQGLQSAGELLKTEVTTSSSQLLPISYPGGAKASVPGQILSVQTTLPNGKTSLVKNNLVTGTGPMVCDIYYPQPPPSVPDYKGPWPASCPASFPQIQSVSEYAYGQGSPGALVKTTTTNYEWQASTAYASANMIDLPSSVVVKDGSGNTISTTTYGYDENNGSPQGVYGNLTSTTVTGPKGGSSKTSTVYNTQGMPVTSIDGNLNQTTYTYGDASVASPSSVCLPTTTPNGATHCSSYTWDADTGKMLTSTDQNGVLTKYSYDDPLGRLTETDAAVGTPQENTTTLSYPTPNVTNTAADEQTLGDQKLKSSTTVDGFGRQIHSTDQTGATVDTTYDNVGNVASTSNPYFTTSDATYGIASYAYDALGRKTFQCQQDNSSSPTTTCTPGNSFQKWTYNSDSVIFQDENGNQWTRTFDAQGNLIKVVEPTAYETDYTYDAVGNLDSVTQCGGPCPSSSSVTRSFTYDSLSRLLTSTNPESGTISYTYDANGNVLTKTEPAPNQTGSATVTVTYTYDQLNRLEWKHYNDNVTIAAGFGYDGYDATGHAISGETYADGRLSQTSEAAAHAISIFSYNAAGGVIKKESCIPGDCNYDVKVNATYNLAGNLATLSNGSPSQPITLSYTYDTAGRLSSITSSWTGANHPSTLFEANSASPASYGPVGLQYALLGATTSSAAIAILNRAYDNRLRPIYEGDTTSAGGSLYSYCIQGPNNPHCTSSSAGFSPNGNVLQLSDSVVGNWSYPITTGYDTLNRLVDGTAATGPYSGKYACWSYDAFGNRTIEAVSTTPCSQSPPPTSWAHYNAKNQVTATGLMPNGYLYDAAGNVLNDGMNQYLYDGENRICAVKSDSNPSDMTGYVYDADGDRVGKGTIPTTFSCNSSNGLAITSGYVVGLSGEQLTETNGGTGWLHTHVFANGQLLATYSSTDTLFELTDWLGTRRADVGASGCKTTWQSLPYGDGLISGPNSNCSDSSELHFTGKERDSESGNDYFGARYYGSTMGRFLSPDPLGPWVADASDPQSWNFYTYARNNPLINTDPTGLDCVYFNDAGTGLDTTPNAQGQVNPIDRNSTPNECQSTGGDWVNGRFTGMTPDANGGDTFDIRSADANGTYDVTATAPGPQSNGQICAADCESTYNFNPAPGYVPEEDISPSARAFVNAVAQQTAPVNKAFNCAGAAAVGFSPFVTPDDAKNVGGAVTDQGVDAAEKGLHALSETAVLSKGARVGAKYLGKAAGAAGLALGAHSAYENMKDAGCFTGKGH